MTIKLSELRSISDRDGIIATHNAADALITVVECLLRHKAAGKAHAKAFGEWSRSGHAESLYDPVSVASDALSAAAKALDTALAKVSP